MCGICGIVSRDKDVVQKENIENMLGELIHRGPDDEGVYLNGRGICDSGVKVGLGHRRLSIIDLSGDGHQPMSNEDKTVWITLNGEIYNYMELRLDLENKGHEFKSQTDTETVIHLYEEYGEDCIKYLRGMFAFGVWDEKKNILLLARDRVGKKPLIYYHKGDIFCFASEFSAVLASGLIKREINPDGINYYLTFGYIPAPLTIYKDIFKLLPAHILVLKDNTTTIKKYWELDYSNKIKISEEDAIEEVLRLLREAVRIRLYSDVPLGAFLSGGIDSSTIVALMSELSEKRVKTFSIGFEESQYDELGYARNVAKKFNTDHHEFIVKPDALRILPLLIERYGEPYADSSCVPTYYVSQQTKQYVTVALNGDGGDELFAGYERYQAMLIAQMFHQMPNFARKLTMVFKSVLPDSVNPKNSLRRLKRFLNGATLPVSQRYLKWVGIFDESLKKEVYSDNFFRLVAKANPSKFINPLLNNGNAFSIDSFLYVDTVTYLPNDLLVKTDITSMANSLEARSPFLDHKLIELVAKLPSSYKINLLVKKYLLKKIAKKLLPYENIHRRKMGFGVPVGEWFRDDLKGFLCEILLSDVSFKRGYFKPTVIKEMVKEHVEMRADYSYHLWALLMLELWHQRFID